MKTIARGLAYVDLHFQGHSRIIATGVLHGAAGVALVDPGPTTCLTALRAALAAHGLSVADVRTVLLTHIHLDHAGVTGSLVRENPRIRVYVHERGAPHMVDPTRLLSSARRLYGADMETLWGECRPVPSDSLHTLAGGERLALGDRELEVAYTPGHASHHVSYFDRATGIAFVGDTAGVRIDATGPDDAGAASTLLAGPGSGTVFIMPPTTPPETDVDAWAASIQRIEAWRPETLFVTHFGPHRGASVHLQALLEHLHEVSRMVRASLERPWTDEDRIAWFGAETGRYLRRHLPEADAVRYERAASPRLCWLGLARYWRKQLDASA